MSRKEQDGYVRKDPATSLRNAQDALERIKTSMCTMRGFALDIGTDLLELGDDNAAKAMMKHLQGFCEEVDGKEQELNACHEGLSHTAAKLTNLTGDDKLDIDLHSMYSEIYDKALGKTFPPSNRQQECQDLMKQIQDKFQSGDTDLMVTEGKKSTKCPFTGVEMTNPVRNPVCGHVYDKEGVKAMIAQRGNRCRCPVAGCANSQPLNTKELVEDRLLKKQIERKKSN